MLGIATVEDFLNFYPIRFIDKSKIYKIKDLKEDENLEIQLKGKISDLKEIGVGKAKRMAAKFSDETGTMDLVWFQYSKWMMEQIPQNREVFIFGKASIFNHQFSMSHPEIEIEEKKEKERERERTKEKKIKKKSDRK